MIQYVDIRTGKTTCRQTAILIATIKYMFVETRVYAVCVYYKMGIVS